jgi:hypothetical protein
VLGDFLLLKIMEQRVCINFCVKNGIKCSKTLEMLTVAYGESTLSKKMFINGISYSKRAEKMLTMNLALDAPARQKPTKMFRK